ncbi:4-hydroxy-tetrahydrodipicolinate synthase [Rudanella paleaurantiibacter]|uniref:4-hydroxy-tetrahydrodipicolinate synthase n=1 Tax=Rudanella paleaurantiibacter TaxID=2614655 RepID=A0A7J5TUA1_9BACT|nr:4-hydroxy-tetrahydrodipicolinate synthase [Rudanella paleaurantiibacter]KAB7727547.1 4-hydroxy-tetrahydrodipicolinate synthase [Rudanella paleaurantiibacter]
MNNRFHGVGVAIVTPFHADHSIDFDGFGRLIQHVSDGGVRYIVLQGTTGESPTVTKAEKKQLLQYLKENNPKQLPIVYGVGGNVTPDVVNTLKETDLEGVDAILSVCPYYNKPGQRGVIEHFTRVADASPVPVILYNIPPRTGINMTAETVCTLAQHPNIIGVKEASCIIEQCMEIARDKPEDFLLISGDDVQAVPIISIGGVGVMSVIANALPARFSALVDAALHGDFAFASKELGHFLRIDPLLYEEGNPVGVKNILEIMGLIEGHVRLPLMKASDSLSERQRAVLQQDHLLELVA